MENEIILEELLKNVRLIEEIRADDGYVMWRISDLARASILRLNELVTDDAGQKLLIKQTVDRLGDMESIHRRYVEHPDYKRFVRKESSHGNMDLFMNAINCVEGALIGFLSELGWYSRKK